MRASEVITQVRIELNEKSEFWNDEELFIKLQRSYVALQHDIPVFITKEPLAIQIGKDEYYLAYTPLKNVSLLIDGSAYAYADVESFYAIGCDRCYTFEDNRLVLGFEPVEDTTGVIVYRHEKHLDNINCEVETPSGYMKALRLLFMSEIHEKPTRNTKERNLSLHYLKLYEMELKKLRVDKAMRPKNIKSNYQRI